MKHQKIATERIVIMILQGCPIGIPKNPEISETDRGGSCSRKSSLGACEIQRVSKVQWGWGVVAEASKKKSVDSCIHFFSIDKQVIKIRTKLICP